MLTLRRCQPLLGTFVEISAHGPVAQVQPALDEAYAAIRHIHQQMSFQDERSDIARLNAAPAGASISVHPSTYHVLQTALLLYHDSDGLFDCAIQGDSAAALTLLQNNLVQKNLPATIDLSGIAKGFAVDRACTILRSHAVQEAIVNAGGDLRVIGSKFATVQLRPDADAQATLVVMAQDKAVATSGQGGGRGAGVKAFMFSHHIVHDLLAVTVIADQAMIADALTKPVWALGAKAGVLLKDWHAEAILHHADGRTTLVNAKAMA